VDNRDIGLHAMMLLKPEGEVNMRFTPIKNVDSE
jgi:hypothetical protein